MFEGIVTTGGTNYSLMFAQDPIFAQLQPCTSRATLLSKKSLATIAGT